MGYHRAGSRMTSSPSKTPLDDIAIGHVLGDRYVIEGLLGEGASAACTARATRR
ncbi:MAG: hypothetical protein M5U09_17595 [Gammaproteobacteria bacterium]|nr:hypothetical protein [Gammaproteobacteria bacterium]